MKRDIGSSVVVLVAAMTWQPVAMPAEPLKDAKPDFSNNVGFPLSFDVSKMDLSADPRQDFRRYAAGKWLDTATLPGDLGNLDAIGLVNKQVERQIASLLVDAQLTT